MSTGITFHLTSTDSYPYSYAIEQGASFNWLTFVIENEDYTDWLTRGQIRNNYPANGGVIKAAFSFDPSEYGEITLPNGNKVMGTRIKPKLSAEVTAGLDWVQSKMILRKTRTDAPILGKNVWFYDIEIFNTLGDVIKISRGWVEVIPEATL